MYISGGSAIPMTCSAVSPPAVGSSCPRQCSCAAVGQEALSGGAVKSWTAVIGGGGPDVAS